MIHHCVVSNRTMNFVNRYTPNIYIFTFTFMHLEDAFIQSDLVYSGYTCFVSMCVPWESKTHNLSVANAMLYHWATGTHI